MKPKEIKRIANDIVMIGSFTVDVSRLTPKVRDALWEAVITVMIDKGLIIQGVGDDLSINGEVMQQVAKLMTHDGDGEWNQ